MTEPPDRGPDGWAVVQLPLDSEPPGPISTEEDEPELDLDPVGATSMGPPGGRIFSLEGRPAAGLYLVAWLFSLGGFGLLIMTLLTAEGDIPSALILLATILLGFGLAAAAGYQIVARTATRPSGAYRGPSPPIVFGVVAALGSIALGLVGLAQRSDSAGFLASLIGLEITYAVAVLLFVVRSGALTWREMGWPVARPMREMLVDVIYGAAWMVPTLFGVALIARVVSHLLGDVAAPDIVPPSSSGTDVILLALATVVVAPIGEELFFRGFALTAWWRDLGVRSALVRSAVFFALIHIINVQSVDFETGVRQVILVVAQILPLGLVLGWLFVRRGIVASIAGHAAYNAVIFLVALSVTGLPNV